MILTAKQRAVLKFIEGWLVANQCTPTIREIGAGFRIKSPNGVVCHLDSLEVKGKIKRIPNESRNIRLVEKYVVLKNKKR